ncbi:uncharacterized protein LOC109857541 isoform X2 [Pseudomyrmex gracilis]|uniref:uncharacterized protein LOC109857541 isoform X2 n=1 Tax=Pseudomyrmex gracilis TaxID=219809 RepID=UPI0009955110|nr:uncharacterized protein LOC109857541 isoform X2 [Pseudomyrmex gracilis]
MATKCEFVNSVNDLDVTKRVVESAENRARLQIKTKASKLSRGGNRQYAQALHDQADELCQRHSVAARRTAAMISSWNNQEKSSARFSTRDKTIMRMTSCPNSAVLQPREVPKSSDNPSIIPDVMKYIDIRKRTSHTSSAPFGSLSAQLTRSRTLLKYVNNRADEMLKNLRTNFNAGKMRTSLKLVEDLLTLSSALEDPHRHRILAYQYLCLIHTALGRHDRACSDLAGLMRLSCSSNNPVLLTQALMIMGKVHLSFDHLEAAARAWENMSVYVDHPLPRAWLHHEIGRCYLEMGKHAKALRKTTQCRECAEEANSKKWIFHADLLRAQCLAMLGRFAEAREELRVAAKISEEEGDTPMLSYIRDLIEQLNRALREVTFVEDRCLKGVPQRLSPRNEELFEGNEAITTLGIRKTTRGKGDDYTQDVIPDQREIDEESSSLESARSFRSKMTNLTYVIESHTDVSPDKGKPAETRNDEEAEVLPRESHMTFKTCYKDSRHVIIDEERTSSFLKQPIEVCSSNIEMSGGRAERETFRISKSCEDGWHRDDFDTAIDKTRYDVVARDRHKRSLYPETRKQGDEE